MADTAGKVAEVAANKTSETAGNPGHSPKSVQNELTKQMEDIKQQNGIPTTGMEEGFYRHFMNPMLARMEETVKKNNEILDEINKKFEQERMENRKKQLSKHIPGPLQGEGQKLDDIMKHIQDLIVYENFSDDETDTSKFVPARLKDLDENAEVAVLSHSVAAYVSTLESIHLRQFMARIISDVTLWTSRLFRFSDGSAYFHEEEREGLLRVCRLALHQKYPKYSTDGYDALFSRPPVIYTSAAAKPGLGQYLCSALGLPISCLCTVPCNTVFGSQHKMDIATLEKLIQDDMAAGKTPLLLIAYAGTPLVGHVDNVSRLQDICKKNEIWLHIEGNNLATLALYSVPTSISPAKSGDSMTLNLSGWLGLPAVPHVTLYKTSEPAQAHAAGLTSFAGRFKLNCLPLWLCLQNLGHEGVVSRIQHSISLAKLMHDRVEGMKSLRNLSKKHIPPEDPEKPKSGVRELITKAINALIIFEIENPTVVFRYQGKVEAGKKSNPEPQEVEEKDPYFDALNIWLCETLKRACPRVQISAVEVENEGISIRFSPLESAQLSDTSTEHVEQFLDVLISQLTILDATVNQRADFHAVIEAQDNLIRVNLSNWAGLGAVQYIPDQWRETLNDLSDHARTEINTLNAQLVHQLKSSDSAFSLGTTDDGMACVRFGLITMETDLEELIAQVYTTGKEVEDSSKFLETMADIVREGIEKANMDLKKENQDKLVQEGVLRQVPLVGSFLNWWSPPPKDVMKGRTFNLASGRIESTETTYKYHMQVQESSPEPSPRQKTPPVKDNLKPAKRPSQGSVSSLSDASSPQKQDGETPVPTANHVDGPALPEPAQEATETTTQGSENVTSAEIAAPSEEQTVDVK